MADSDPADENAPAPAAAPDEPAASTAVIKKGCRVRLHDLTTAVLNGAVGAVVGNAEPDSGRFPVKLLQPAEVATQYPQGIKVRPSNLEVVPQPQPHVQAQRPKKPQRQPAAQPQQAQPQAQAQAPRDPTASTAWVLSHIPPGREAEWFIDAYRLHVDDAYAHGGGELRGLYSQAGHSRPRPDPIFTDFLTWCKLAARSNALPAAVAAGWARALSTAATLLPYATEKSDVSDKWGMMAPMIMRLYARVVCGEEESLDPTPEEAVQEELGQARPRALLAQGAAVFAEVGGVRPWKQLWAALGGR